MTWMTSELRKKYGSCKSDISVYMYFQYHCCGVSGGINSTESWAYYKMNSDWFLHQSQAAPEFVPTSCCRDPENTPNITKCQGLTDRTIIPFRGPPVAPRLINDQLYTEVC